MKNYVKHSNKKLSPLIDGEVEGDAAEDVLSVLEVPEEADCDVEAGDDDHGRVEDAVPAAEVVRRGHLVLHRQHDPDPLERVDRSPEEQRQLAPVVKIASCSYMSSLSNT